MRAGVGAKDPDTYSDPDSIGSMDPYRDPDSLLGSGTGSKREKLPTKIKKVKNFHFLKCCMFSFELKASQLGRLLWRPRGKEIANFDQNIPALLFSSFFSRLNAGARLDPDRDPYPDSLEIQDPDPDS